ncbi:MAG TPA: hypothetical protein VFG28_09680 [Syntrophales bacterium]|jgi:hypothetical protein|nr:hypothetical protein [Syntrophales bacterium]
MVTRIVRIIVLVSAAAGMFIVSPSMTNAGQAVNAKTVAEHMDKSKYSSAEIKSYLKGLKGSEITAEGKIDEILSGKTGNRVVVFVKIPGREREFVVDVYVSDSGKLNKNDQVSCKGEYAKYNMFTLNGIALKDGTCTKR